MVLNCVRLCWKFIIRKVCFYKWGAKLQCWINLTNIKSFTLHYTYNYFIFYFKFTRPIARSGLFWQVWNKIISRKSTLEYYYIFMGWVVLMALNHLWLLFNLNGIGWLWLMGQYIYGFDGWLAFEILVDSFLNQNRRTIIIIIVHKIECEP